MDEAIDIANHVEAYNATKIETVTFLKPSEYVGGRTA